MSTYNLPTVRIGCNFLVRNEKWHILLIQRKWWNGDGTWCFPGGHFEADTTLVSAAIRELYEEVWLTVLPENTRLLAHCERWNENSEHTLTLQYIFTADIYTGVPANMEPDMAYAIWWHDIANLPEIFYPHIPLVRKIIANIIY
jgi:8-oxo-dGTP diphosphatase